MSGHQFDELNDRDRQVIADAEADLERLLAVDPSPAFAARVRTRISGDRESTRWFAGWGFSLAAATIVLVGIIVGLAIRRSATEVPPPEPAVASTQPAPALPASSGPPSANDERAANLEPRTARLRASESSRASARPRQSLSPRVSVDKRRRASREPEVLVPADQRNAMDRLLALASAGKITEEMLPAERLPAVAGADTVPVPPLVVQELQVPAIGTSAGGEVGRGRN